MIRTTKILLLCSLLFPAFHAYAGIVDFDKNRVTSVQEVFCVSKGVDNSDIAIIAYTANQNQYANISFSPSAQLGDSICTNLYDLLPIFQDENNLIWGDALEFFALDSSINGNALDECIGFTKEVCQSQIYTSHITNYPLRVSGSILGTNSANDYIGATVENTGAVIDDFYPVAGAVLGLLIAFLVFSYLMGLFSYSDPLLEKTKKLSKEVDEHIKSTTESYTAWNRRKPRGWYN